MNCFQHASIVTPLCNAERFRGELLFSLLCAKLSIYLPIPLIAKRAKVASQCSPSYAPETT